MDILVKSSSKIPPEFMLCALKDIFKLCEDTSEIINVINEATTLNQLSHENIISVEGADHFETREGIHMLILMEYCDGGNFKERLRQTITEDENLQWML